MLNFADYFMERYGGAQPVILYHGTPARNLPAILSQGLIPNPKKRAWNDDPDASFRSPSRASLEGIYLTNNVMTAMSAAGNGGNKGVREPLIIMVQVQPRSAFQDEDDVTYTTSKVPMPGISPDHEYSLLRLYKSYLDKDDPEFVQSSQEAYVKNGLDWLVQQKFHPERQNPQLLARVNTLLQQGWLISLQRKMAHLDPYYLAGNRDLPRPSVAQAEAAYSRYMDQMTRVLKMGTREETQSRQSFQQNMRVTEPIRFRGTNRILAIFEIVTVPGEKYKQGVVLSYPANFESIPSHAMKDFEKQWTERIGEFRVVDRKDIPR